MFEVDVDVRGFTSFLRNESLEQDVNSIGIDAGHSQTKADDRIRGRTTTLTQNPPTAGESNQVPDRQEIGFVMEHRDQLQLVFDQIANLVRQTIRITLLSARPGQLRQPYHGRHATRREFFRVFISQFVKRKCAAPCNFQRLLDRRWTGGKESS